MSEVARSFQTLKSHTGQGDVQHLAIWWSVALMAVFTSALWLCIFLGIVWLLG